MTDANRARRPSKRARGGGNAAPAADGGARARRRAAERLGVRAETWAAAWLILKGYRVLARRLRSPAGEVDLVVRRGGLVVAVEVKARPSLAAAVDAVSPRQRWRVARGLESFLAGRPDLAGLDRRFDLVAVRPWRLPVHLVDIWRPGG
ncbi:MAG: YraN family protein [Thalassobaculum sp.]|uniref:YraN family protein n=1 Tax=Thalassobaculum sp. TaxID=2022740 RepID=UPI0032EF5D7D